MRILVTGANGQLGNEMQVLAKENPQHTYYFTDVQELLLKIFCRDVVLFS